MGIRRRRTLSKSLTYFLLFAGVAIVFIPFWYMIVTSLKPQAYVFEIPPRLWPREVTLRNYTVALGKDLFGLYFLNSLMVAVISTGLTVFVASMLAYAFARLRFPFKEPLFYLLLPDWTAFPRYGFLTDFAPDRADIETTLERLARFHINGLQFYDWQYRHDQLLPPTEQYVDPLGRTLSLRTVRDFITGASTRGIASMPYLAIYAASLEFWRSHPEWALYNEEGEALTFIDFLGLMDPIRGGSWAEHLLAECERVLAALPFAGFHVDQYGEPKHAFNAMGHAVDLPQAFVDFISALKQRHPAKTVTFNAVGNWPIAALATSPQDFEYIEIWPPDTGYDDLLRIVREARSLSGGRPVVIALYQPAERPANIRLADALILSAGGTRIELGENARLLADPYFPKHEALSPELEQTLRRYYDFAVRYGELIGPGVCAGPDLHVGTPPDLCCITRAAPGRITVGLVNLAGIQNQRWDEDHPAPTTQERVEIVVEISGQVSGVWWASPDRNDMALTPAPCRAEGNVLHVTLPYLDYWIVLTMTFADED